jgi:rubrerythrin
MRALHEQVLAQIAAERRRLSRRRLVAGSAKLAGGGALALSLAGLPRVGRAQDATPAATEFESDVDVLNYALTLEHLENAFYRDGLAVFPDLGVDDFGLSVTEQIAAIGAHEAAHVATLTEVITQLGGDPVQEATYDFADAYADEDAFLMTAMALENTGVSAYNGAGQFLTDPDLLTAAGSIVSVEARHAAYLNFLNEENPFPAAFDEALTPDEVLEIAGPFIAS